MNFANLHVILIHTVKNLNQQEQLMTKKNIHDLRKSYHAGKLERDDLSDDPLEQFTKWFDQLLTADVLEPNAMALATADPHGTPSVRMVLLKSYDNSGFVFYTNYNSRKGKELMINPRAALLFWWDFMERQVRIEGVVEKTSAKESDEYFQQRPRESQIGAWASEQSQPLEDRAILEERFRFYAKKFEGKPIPRPINWGGFRLIPEKFEFWQGRENRLHDRFLYERIDTKHWRITRLNP
jgi:pyridoxamine 5'-phosphate oxidase